MNGPSLLIAGCGYVGLALSRRLSAAGWRVWGLRRNPEAVALIKEAGAEPVIADLTDPSTLAALPQTDYVVSCQGAGRGADYRATYLEGAKNLIAALKTHPPKKSLWISSTRVYGETQGEEVDETTPPRPETEEGKILLEAELVVLKAPFPSMILRPAGIYGPGRARLKLLSAPSIDLNGYANHVHVEDVVGLIVLLLEKGKPGEVYLGADDKPVLKSEFYPWLARAAGVPLPPAAAGGGSPAGKRISNRKVKNLGYKFKHPDYLSGFPELFQQK